MKLIYLFVLIFLLFFFQIDNIEIIFFFFSRKIVSSIFDKNNTFVKNFIRTNTKREKKFSVSIEINMAQVTYSISYT
jgi:hypothetical protein